MRLGPIKGPIDPARQPLWDYFYRLNDWMLAQGIIDQEIHDGMIETVSYDGMPEPFSVLCGELEDARIQLPPEQLEEMRTLGMQLDDYSAQDVLDIQETH